MLADAAEPVAGLQGHGARITEPAEYDLAGVEERAQGPAETARIKNAERVADGVACRIEDFPHDGHRVVGAQDSLVLEMLLPLVIHRGESRFQLGKSFEAEFLRQADDGGLAGAASACKLDDGGPHDPIRVSEQVVRDAPLGALQAGLEGLQAEKDILEPSPGSWLP